jgi:centrosomal protein CEP290
VGAAGGAGEAAVQLTALRARVAQLEADNQDLRSELGAFDPAFFEEIEDLKHEHYQLTQKCAAQELQIAQLQQQLTVR